MFKGLSKKEIQEYMKFRAQNLKVSEDDID